MEIQAEKLHQKLMKVRGALKASVEKDLTTKALQESVDNRLALLKEYGVTKQGSLSREGKAKWKELEERYKRAVNFLPHDIEYQTEIQMDKWCKRQRKEA